MSRIGTPGSPSGSPEQDQEARLRAEFPLVIEIPVQWGELDAYGHVNNVVYFRYFESSRIAYFDRCGLLETYQRSHVGAILHSTSCRFRLPLQYPDTAVVGTRISEVQEDRFTMLYRVVSRKHHAVAAEGQGIVVAFDYATRTKTRIPQDVRQGIQRMEAREA